MKRSLLRSRRAAVRRSAPARRPRPLGVSLARFGSVAAMCGALVAGVGSAKAATYSWTPTTAGAYSWGLGANWSPAGFPNAIGDEADFNNNLTGNQQISLNQTITLGTILIGDPDGTNSFTLLAGANGLGAPGYLNLDVLTGSASILKAAGADANDVIATGLQFNDNLAVTNNSTVGSLTLAGPLRSLTSDISFNGAGFINTGAISTAGSLVKNDAGTTMLSLANIYGGATTVNGGTLRVGNAASLPTRSALTVAGGATFDLNGFAQTIGSLTGGGLVTNTSATAVILTVGRDDTNTTFTGTIAPTTPANIALTKIGKGVLTLAPSAASTYTGNTIINGGGIVLDFANTSSTSLLAATPLQIAGGDFSVKGKAGVAVNQTLGALTVGATGGTITMIAGDAAGTNLTTGAVTATASGGALLINAPVNTSVKLGTSFTTLSNRIVFTDGTAGVYNWATNTGATTTTTGFTGYTAFPTNGGATTDNTLLSTSQAQTALTTTGLLKLASTAGSTQSLDLGGFNTVINSNGLLIAGTDAWNITGAGNLQGPVAGGDLVIHQYNAATTISTGISNNTGVLALVKAGTGTLTISGNNSFTGAVFVDGGTLSFNNATGAGNGTLGLGSTTAVTIRDGATLQYTGATGTISGAAATVGAHTFTLQGGNANIDVTQSGAALTLAGVISGGGGFTKLGAGTLTLSGVDTYTGPTIVNAGSLKVGVSTAIPSLSPVILNNSAILDLSTFGLAGVGSLSSASPTAAVNAGAVVNFFVGNDNTSTSYAGTFTGIIGAQFIKQGSGVMVVSGATSAWTGATFVRGGVLKLGANNVFNALSPLILGDAGGVPVQFDMATFSQTLGAVTFFGSQAPLPTVASQANLSVGTGTLTIGGTGAVTYSVSPNVNPPAASITGGAGGSIIIAGVHSFTIGDSLSVPANQAELTVAVPINQSASAGITKSGLGNLLLSGASSYTGVTTVSAGNLTLDMNAGGSLNSATALTLGSAGNFANFIVKGSSSGTSAQAMNGTFTTTAGSYSVITLDPNNGGGTSLTLGSAWTLGAGATTLLDYSSANSGARQVITNTATTGTTLTNGIYPAILVKDSSGVVGFGTRAAGTNVAITRYDDTTGTTLADNSNSATTNFTTLNTTYTGGTLNWTNAITTRAVNSLTIDTTNNGGIIDMGAATNVLTLTGGAILFKGNNNLTLQGGQVGASSTNVTIDQTSTTGVLTISSLISSAAAVLNKNGDGTLILNNSNTYTGVTNINAGTLKLGQAGGATNTPLGTTATGTIVNAGGALDLGGFTLGAAEALALIGTGVNGAGALTNSGGAATYSGIVTINGATAIGGTGDITLSAGLAATAFQLDKVGSNTLTLSAISARTGATSIDGGTIKITAATALGAVAATAPVTLNGGTLNLTSDTAATFGAYPIVLAADSTIVSTTAAATTGIAQTLGTLSLGSNTLNVNSGSVPTTGTETLNFGAVTLVGNPTLNVVNSTGGAVTLMTAGALNDGGVAARTITKSGNGTLQLATAATSLLDGTRVNITGGTLNSNLAAALGTLAAVDVSSGATFSVGASQQIGSLSGLGSVTLGNAFVLTIGNTVNNLGTTFGGVISGGNATSGIVKAGTGTLTLNNSSTYLGTTAFNAGTVQLNAATNTLPATTAITLANANNVATLNLNGNAQTVAGLTFGGASGGVATQGVVNTGGGTLTLAGDVTYTSTGNSTLTSQINGGVIDLGGAVRNFTIGDSTGTAVELSISSGFQNGSINKAAGIGTLLLTGTITAPSNFFTLASGAGSLIVTGPVTSSVPQTWTNGAFSNTLSGLLNIASKLDMGASNALTVTGVGQTQLANVAPGTGANVLSTINVNAGVIGGLNLANGAATGTVASTGAALATGSNSLSSATINLSGASSTLRLAPALGTSLTSGTSPGLLAKTYQSGTTLTSLGVTNFLGNPNQVAFSGTFAFLNLPGGVGTIPNLPLNTASTQFPANTSIQVNGLLNITSPGVYYFNTITDDGSTLTIDGNAINSTANTAGIISSMFLTSGLHVFNQRVNNNATNGNDSVRYQGPDTNGILADIPASAFFQANSTADLATTFGNNITIASGTSATIEAATNTTLSGSLSTIGSVAGTTLNVAGTGNLTTVTFGGATTLTTDLTVGTATANAIFGGPISGAFNLTKTGFGTMTLTGANSYTGTTITTGTVQVGNGGATGTLGSGAVTDNATLIFNRSGTLTQGTDFGNISGTGAVQVIGSGTTTFSGTNTYAGTTTVSTGTLNITGTLAGPGSTIVGAGGTLNVSGAGTLTGNGTSTALNYGGSAGVSTVNISGTGGLTNFFATTGSAVANSVAIYNQSGGTVAITPGTGNAQYVSGAAGYGYFNLTGSAVYKASVAAQRFDVTAGSSTGVAFIGGNSSLNFASGEYFLVAYNGNNALGQLTVADSAAVDHSSASQAIQIFWSGTNMYGVLNMAGGTLNNTGRAFNFGGSAANTTSTGFVNLAAGTTTAAGFTNATVAGSTGNKAFINFAGGTYKASGTQTLVPADGTGTVITTTLFGPINNAAVGGPSFAGGLTIDTNGFAVTSNRVIAGADSSFGVTQGNIVLPVTGNTGYAGAPAVQFSAPSAGGVPAAGYALITGGAVTGIVITDPGTYATGETPTITLTGGGGTIAPFAATGLTTANLGGGLTAIGTGSLVLSGNSTFTGPLTVGAGSLTTVSSATFGNIGVASPIGAGSAAANAASLVINGGILNYTGASATTTDRLLTLGTAGGEIDGAGTNTIGFTNTGSLAYAGAGVRTLTFGGANTGTNAFAPLIGNASGGTDAVSIVKTGAGTWMLSNGSNSYTGGTTVLNGILQVGGSNALSSAAVLVGDTTGTNAATLQLGGTGALTGGIAVNNAITVRTGSSGAATLSGANTSGTNTFGGGVTLAKAVTLDAAAGGTVVFSGVLDDGAGSFAVTKGAGTGIVELANANTYDGGTVISAGTLRFDTNLSRLGTGGVTFSGGALQWGAGNTTDVSTRTLTFTAAPIFDTNGNNVTLGSAIGGSALFGITKTGAGALYLPVTNAFGAVAGSNIAINGGTLKIDAEAALGNVLNDVVFGGAGAGTLQITTGFTPNAGKTFSFTAAGGGTLQIDSGTLVESANNQIIGLAGTGGLIKTGAGTLNLNQTNGSYDSTGVGANGATNIGFRIDAGTLLLTGSSTSVVGDINPNTMTMQLNGGTLTIQTDTASIARANLWVSAASSTVTVDRATNNAGIAQAIGTGTGAGLTMGTGSSVLNIAGGSAITSGTETVSFTGSASLMVSPTFNVTNATGGGAVSLSLGGLNDNGVLRTITKTGNGALIFSAAATALTDGTPIVISGGSLASNNATALGANGLATIDVAGGATFTAGASQTVAKITNSGTVNIGAGFTLTDGSSNNLSTTFPGSITSTATSTFAKGGTGDLLLTGTSPGHLGATAVQNGTIRLGGGDNRLGASSSVVLGNGTTSGKLIIGGDASGAPGSDPSFANRVQQTITALSMSGTGLANSVVGGASGGTSAGTPVNNSVLTLNVGSGVTDTYAGFIGGLGAFENNLNLVKSGTGTLVLTADLTNWTGTQDDSANPGNTDLLGDATRPTLTIAGGVLRATGILNTYIAQTGGVFDDQTLSHGPNFFLKVTGGLVALSQTNDTFLNSGLTSGSSGVAALNISGNTSLVDVAGSNMYLGAIGARSFTPTSLAAGSGATYRFGGGAPWNALGSATAGGSGGYLQIGTNVVTGANNVIIGDNGSYAAGLFGSLSTVEFLTSQSYSGTTSVQSGTLIFNNVTNALGTNTAANSILLNGDPATNNGYNATLRWGAATTTDLSARIGIVGGGTIDTGANNVAFTTAIGNTAGGTGGLNKIGTGTLTLSKSNTYVGPTGLSQGTLSLDFNQASATTTDILSPASSVILAGGTLTVNAKGGATVNNQRLVATNLVSGSPILNLTTTAAITGSFSLALGDINRSVGSGLNIVAGTNVTLGNATTGNVITTTQNTNGIISGGVTTSGTGITGHTWAVSGATQTAGAAFDTTTSLISVGSLTAGSQVSFAAGTAPGGLVSGRAYYVVNPTATDFQVALTPGGSAVTLTGSNGTTSVNKAGVITGLAAGSYTASVAATTAPGTTANVDFQASNTTAWNTQTVNSVRFNTALANTLTMAAAQTLTVSSGGILVGSNVGNLATIITGGTIQGPAGGDLIVNNYDTSSSITIASVIADNGSATGLTKNGTGVLALSAANTFTGVATLNGGVVNFDVDVAATGNSVLGNSNGAAGNIIVNGSSLQASANVATRTFARLFSIGLLGATVDNSQQSSRAFNFTNTGALGFQGSGARTFTLTGGSLGLATFAPIIGDNGGPTSFAKSGAGYWGLTGNNTYTGTTTINQGILRVTSPTALPGGLGAVAGSLSPSNTGGGNLIFNGTGTNNTVLELATGSGNFYRGVGTGIDQVSWTAAGIGGFAAAGTDAVVNLGGSVVPTTLVWNSTPGFLGTGTLLFGDASASNKIDFQNPLDLNGAATRTVQVDNGNAVVEAEISGALKNGVAGTSIFTKTGLGALLLSGVNNTTGLINTVVNNGFLVLPNATTAVPGTDAGRTITVNANSAVVVPGATDLTALLGRLNTASTGVVAWDTSNSVSVDLTALPNVYLGAYSNPGGTPIYYNGTVTPNNNTYKFSNAFQASPGAAAGAIGAVNLLVLNGANMLANNGATPRSLILGGNNTAQGGTGSVYLTSYNTYTGGTTIGQATGASGTNSQIGVGNDAALGTGLITLNDGRLGALNGDRTLSNNIKTTGTTGNTGVGGTLASDFIANPGAMTYLGTADFTSLTTGAIFTRTAVVPAIFLGDVKTSATNQLTLLTSSSGPVTIAEFLTTPAGSLATKTMSSASKGFNIPGANPGGVGIVIDSAGSLGAAPAANVANFINLGGVTNASVQVLPGITAPIALSANEGVLTSSGALFAFTVNGTPSINDSTGAATAGLIGNSDLTFAGVISGASSGGPALNKLGYGTLTLQGKNTATLSAANGLAIENGTLRLDFANSAANDASALFTVTPGLLLGSNGVNTQVGTVSTLAAGPATLALLGKSGQINGQTFGPVTNASKDNSLFVNSNGGTVNLTLGLITNTLGGTMAVTLPSQGSITIGATNTTLASGATTTGTGAGLLADANLNPYVIVGGNEWGAKNASNNIVAGSSLAGFYTAADLQTANSNADLVANTALNTGTTVFNSLRLNTAATLTLNIGGGNILTAPGILMGTDTTSAGNSFDQTISNGTLRGSASKGLAIYQANPAALLNISSVIADNTAASSLSKAGPGTLVLTGTNTYTGVTYFNGGVISVGTVTAGGAAGPLGASANAAANWVFNGGSLRYTGATGTTDHGAVFNSISAIDVTQSGATLTLGSGAIGISGLANTPGILRKIGPGALTLGGTVDNNSLSVEVASGTLNLGKTSTGSVHALGLSNGAALIVDNAATARLTGGGNDQIFDGSSVLVKTGGALDLNALSEAIDGLAGGGTVNSATGTPILTIGAANDAAISAYTVGAAGAGVASTGLNYFNGTLSGTLGLTKAGAGTQILAGTSTYTGATLINTGLLKMGGANALPNGVGKGNVTIVGNLVLTGLIVPGALDLGGYDQAINGLNSTTGGVVVNTPTISFTTAWTTPFGVGATTGTSTLSVGNGDAAGAFNGILQDGYSVLPVAGAGAGTAVNGLLALNKVGTGTQILSGINTYSGGTTVSGGLLQLSGTGTIGASGKSLTLAGGGLDMGGSTLTVGALAITGAATSGDTLLNGSITGSSYVASNTTGTATISANLLGASSLSKTGAGTLALFGNNNYSGGTTIDGGTVQINSTSSLGAIAGGAVINAGTLQATADITTARNFQLGGATSTVAVDSGKTYSVSGTFNDGASSGTLNKAGLGTLVLTATNGYTGGTNVAAGTLQVGNGTTVGTLGSGAITTGTNATLAIKHSDTVTIATAIGGTGNFAQTGSGTTILTGANNYGGTTTISSGTLQVGNGTTVGTLGTGAVTNNANLNFMRTDTVTVASTIGGSGTVTQSGGTLNLNGAVTGQALHVASGQVNLGTGDTSPANPNHSLTALTIDSGNTVQIASGGVKLVQATSLTLAGTATLDLTSNAFVLNYAGSVEDPSKTASIASLLQTGFAGGLWNGIGGITTSKVANDMAANPTTYQYLTGIGYMPGALAGGTFLGRAVDAGSVVARYTYYGDANLDGVVNGLDYGLIDSGFAAQNNPGFVYGWVNGDFNYDGKIDGSDYALIDTAAAFTNGVPIAPAAPEAPSSLAAVPSSFDAPVEDLGSAPMADMASLPAAVPEPASFGLLMFGGALLGLGRRRKAKLN